MCFEKCRNHFVIITYSCFDSKGFLDVKGLFVKSKSVVDLVFFIKHVSECIILLKLKIPCSFNQKFHKKFLDYLCHNLSYKYQF